MSSIRALWLRLQASLWFVPTLVVAGCMALAVLLVESHGWVEADLAARWPRLFGAGTDGARSMLSAIATSMITVAGVVFSVTIVALSLASSQYSPRVLRNFMSDRPTQLVLGVFVGIFAYCLVVLRTVRSDDDGPGFLPSLAVMGGVVLALFGVAMLIYFIHHVATSIQVSSILQRIARDTTEAIDRLFPDALGRGLPPNESCLDELPTHWQDVPAPATGYLVGVDDDGLLALAGRLGRVVQLAHRIGDFVIEGQPLVRVSGDHPLDKPAVRALCGLFALQPQRTVHQDAAYGLQQIVDVGLKALSLDSIAEHARGEATVLGKLLHTLSMLGAGLKDPQQLHALRQRLALLCEAIEQGVDVPTQREPLLERVRMLALQLQQREADAKAHGPSSEQAV